MTRLHGVLPIVVMSWLKREEASHLFFLFLGRELVKVLKKRSHPLICVHRHDSLAARNAHGCHCFRRLHQGSMVVIRGLVRLHQEDSGRRVVRTLQAGCESLAKQILKQRERLANRTVGRLMNCLYS